MLQNQTHNTCSPTAQLLFKSLPSKTNKQKTNRAVVRIRFASGGI
jgi:hypothetical protein